MKRNALIWIICVVLTLTFIYSGCTKKKQKSKELTLKEDLSIGVESDDERYMFAEIGAVALDEEENIYVLDWKDSRIKKFDKNGSFLKEREIQKGSGPEEASYITGMAVTEKGKIFAHDRNTSKILVLDEEFEFQHSFTIEFRTVNILHYSEDKFLALGLNDERIFHIFNKEGELLESFGEPFAIPSEYNQYEGMSLIKLPRKADRTRDGKIFLLNIHKYEIRVYKDNKLHHLITHESDFFQPFKILKTRSDEEGYQMIRMRFPFVTVLEHKNRLYVNIMSWEEDSPHQLDIFENEKCVASLKTFALASAIDKKGRLYAVEQEDFPRVIRYSVELSR